jgi:hypothetical protein
MTEQRINSDPHLGNWLPLKHADSSNGIDDRFADSIFDYFGACWRTTRTAVLE